MFAADQEYGPSQTETGSWVYYRDGEIDVTYTGLIKTEDGWLYFKNGINDKKYSGIVSNLQGMWYVKDGTVAWGYTGLVKFCGKQWYVQYGQVAESYTGMVYDQDTWYFVTDGIATWNYSGNADKLEYGKSESGRPLTVYRFGNGNNTMLITFAIHGFEDGYYADASALVYSAFKLMRELDANAELINSGNWSIYIIPCANPDGLLDGYSNNGPGRLTTGASSYNGSKYAKGIDINRSFPYLWRKYTEARNYNGDESLFSSESRALYKLASTLHRDGTNICIDVHGWYGQIVTTGTDNQLYQLFHAGFPSSMYAGLIGSYGYFSAWAYSVGYDSCLFEFPGGIHSFNDFWKSGYSMRFNKCILNILETY